MQEYILDPKNQRLVVYPIQEVDIWDHYKKQLASFWTIEELDFSKDRDQYNKLSEPERYFIKHILAFFASSDSIVSLNIMNNFCSEVTIIEAQICYTYQAMIENIHAESYSLMIDTYITCPQERNDILSNVSKIPVVQAKVEWANKWSINTQSPFSLRLIAFIIVEGLFFSGAFCAIYWLKQRNLLPGLTKSNEFIARDEGQHAEFALLLYHKLANKIDQDTIIQIMKSAVDIETDFINESISCRMIGMNTVMMSDYIRYVADDLLFKLNCPKIYHSKNPFQFMDLIGMNARSNFFEERVSLYQRPDNTNINYDDNDDDF